MVVRPELPGHEVAGKHSQHVHYDFSDEGWWITCVHCGESSPLFPHPTDTTQWLAWNAAHPCFVHYYDDSDREWIASLIESRGF